MSNDYAGRAEALTALAKASSEFPDTSLYELIQDALYVDLDEGTYGPTDRELAERLKKYIEWRQEKEEAYKKWNTTNKKKEAVNESLIF